MNRTLAAGLSWVAIVVMALAGCAPASTPRATPSPSLDCPSVPPSRPKPGGDPMAAEWLADEHDIPFEEAVTILRLQGRLGELSRALSESSSVGYEDILIRYEPCYRIEVRVQGDSSEVVTAMRESGLDDLVPYVRFAPVLYTEDQLTSARIAGEEAVGDALTASDLDMANYKILFWVASEGEIEPARQRLQDAINSGEITLPLDTFRFEVGEPVNL